jgi:hypothetical protein
MGCYGDHPFKTDSYFPRPIRCDELPETPGCRFISHSNQERTVTPDLFSQAFHVLSGSQRHHGKAGCQMLNDIQGVTANRTRRAKNGQSCHDFSPVGINIRRQLALDLTRV